tara:strand:- start:1742 stop:2377 length:636 start_codon:yes stop_codon:yes gene_type:complete
MVDKPTVKVETDGTKFWHLNGELHREDGPAVEYAGGYKAWFLKGKRHREDGPAIEWADGYKAWHLKGKRHREDGPAVERADGSKSWYLNGENVTEEDVMGKSKDNVNNPSTESDGGPSSYYDMPFQKWVTLNDQMEYLAQNKWGIYAIHLKDVFKGLGRWGDKSGTTPLYDTKKGIYYFCRVMKMMVGVKGLREYLQSLLDDPQFKEKNNG